jgi:F420H(2)-dependent quinone reductase
MSERRDADAGREFSRPAEAVLKLWTAAHTAVYRLSGGKLGTKMGKSPVLLLETVGRKSGKRRTSPLFYLPDGDRFVIVASKGGAARDPAWWLNLKAKPRTEVQVGPRRVTVDAEQANPDERARLWPRLTAMYPSYDGYQKKTTRQIPVIVLRPSGAV